MSTFTFQPVPSVGGLYQVASGDTPPVVNPKVSFLLPVGVTVPPGPLTAAAAWAQTLGTYVFLGAAPSNPAAFVAAARQLLSSPSLAGTRLLWLQNPDAPIVAWSYVAVGTTNGASIFAATIFGFRNYGLAIDGGALLSTDAAGLEIQPASQAGAVRITVDDGQTAFPATGGNVSIPLTGPSAGCLCFGFTVQQGSGGAAPIDRLDIGCHFHFDDAGWPGMSCFDSQRYPIFDTTSATIAFSASMDPLAPMDPVRTRWSFTAGQTLPTFYRTNLGHTVALAPQTGSGLVFAPRPRGTAASLRDPFTLVPDGSFAIAVTPSTAPRRVVLGASGAEYVDLGTTQAILVFAAGQPAYAPSFSSDSVSTAASLDESGLASQGPSAGSFTQASVTTSWGALLPPSGTLPYYAQPDASALYTGQAGTSGALLSYLPVVAEKLLAAPASGPVPTYPVVPYAGLVTSEVPNAGLATGDFSTYARLEREVLSPTRRHAIYAARGPASPAAPGATRAVTPQGFLSTFSADLSYWATLELAQSGSLSLVLNGVVDPLKSALFSNQQFLVLSNPSSVASYFSATQDSLSIEGWIFQLDPSLWAQHSTVFILKNCDRSLSDLVADVGAWSLGEVFNTDVGDTQGAIQAIFQDASARLNDPAAPVTDYDYFVNTVMTDPNWNGLLVLSCPVPLTGLPDALSGLAAGIDAARFFAHHLGVNQTPISNADLSMSDSSLFGLIRYDGNPGDGVPPGETFGFEVESLYVLFENSAIQRFSSQVILTIDALFGAPATQEIPTAGLPQNAILLTGSLVRQGGADTYVFAEGSPTTFDLADAVLQTARIDQASFSAGVTRPPGGATGPQQNRFAFRGALCFRPPPAGTPDLFSFDELAYVNLGVVMTFDLTSQNPPHFDFDPSGVTFDLAHSTTRAGALVGHFPLKLTGLLFSSGNKPGDLGYRPVHPPVETAAVGSGWYGLSFDLNLGTLGALGPSGAFTTSFALVWSPAPAAAQPPVFVGLKLPGPSGSFEGLPLMGLIKLKTFANQLTYSNGGFVLRINGISLSFFGVTLPPGVKFDFLVFGDPSGGGSMGWYGAYVPQG